eukprot:CAMPEP_0196764640 /NCGR_PEP_ID=MMETSP1095-20130614/6544_1 /TAXON_ID=96789 ORGANISM="Chromulina nebulosa, Strain UTEXLB2642" /NCGR_SAMPLE_ID=MMETSP1095 /ASSEMBLY_ACC=CAM_ASM_000446 /LENGTH=375 /DNA_ID=CAMNT_0042120715 /DNA_START=82 /DNA_END=1209 /DNA_ORIENTATION=+
MKTFPSNIDQAKGQGFKPFHEDIGEGVPIEKDGTCSHHYLFPNMNKTKCILPQRIDIGAHYITTGGLDGAKEVYESMVDRLNSFGRYTFITDIDKYPAVKKLFTSTKFIEAATTVCPKDKPHLDPFQFNYIIQVPGQTVAVHTDVPYFWGAGRRDFPQWLLATMVFSGLWKDEFIDQVQVVGYLHDWKINNSVGGEFVYYNNNSNYVVVNPKYRSGSVIDGSKLLHAAKVYRPDVLAPHLDKDKENVLVYDTNDKWEVRSGDKVIQSLSTNDLRIAVVYRARCFKSSKESEEYSKYTSRMSLDNIINSLKDELVRRQIVSKARIDAMNELDLALFLTKSYIQYPLPPLEFTYMPYNYCALSKLLPWTKPFIELIC